LSALKLYTRGSAWFSREDDVKGRISPGQYADLAVLSADYLNVPDDEIRDIESVLTVLGGRIVYGADEFSTLSPPLPPPSPDWTPVKEYGGYAAIAPQSHGEASNHRCHDHAPQHTERPNGGVSRSSLQSLWGPLGCGCWAY
jgi:hypothetical protein